MATPGGHRADADLGHELDADPRPRVGVLEVVDQLRQVLDRVDVVVRRRADQADARRRVPDLGDPGPDLVAGELPPLARLGPLRHLDLELVGVDQVLARHAEPARGDLLDRAPAAVAVGVGRRTGAGSSPPSPVLLLPPSRFMAMASVSCASPLIEPYDIAPVANRLTIDSTGSTSSIGTGWHLSSLKSKRPRSVQSRSFWSSTACGVRLEDVVAARPGRVLEPEDRLGVEQVELPLAAPLVLAPLVEERRPDLAGGVGAGVVVERLAGDLLEADAADPRRGLVEVAVDELLAQADRLEDLRPAVALDGADAHLGHHLDDPLLDRLAVACRRPRRGRSPA